MTETDKKILHNCILKAIKYLDENSWEAKNNSRTGDLVYKGKLYPTKPLLSNVNDQIENEGLDVVMPVLSGGEAIFKFLEKLGFEIRRKGGLQILIENYKQHIYETHLKDEIYKWELLNVYKGRPNLEAPDLLAEFKSIKYQNLIYAMGLAVLYQLITQKPEEMRSLFRMLFNESQDLNDRIKKFNTETLIIYRSLGETLQHHQDERTIASYLTFHNPEKYTFYKFSFYKKLCTLFNEKPAAKNEKYSHYLLLLNSIISDYIQNDTELIQLVKSYIPDYYDGSNHLLLAQDILYQMLDKRESKDYWIYAPGQNASKWEEFYQAGIMGLGWDALGDLNSYPTKNDIKKRLQELEEVESSKQNDTAANYEFQKVIKEGDVIIVKKGVSELLGYGEVTSDYFYDDKRMDYQKCRTVDWKIKGNWKVNSNLPLKTLTNITKYDSGNASYSKYYEELIAIMEVGSDNSNNGINVKEEFIEWMVANVSGGNYYKNQFGSKRDRFKKELSSYEEIYENEFDGELFTLNSNDYKNDIELIKSNIYKPATSFAEYSDKHFSGRPKAILGNKNYIRFLLEKFNDTTCNSMSLNQILYGPPGTGKTYNTVLEAAKIVSGRSDLSFDDALDIFNANLKDQIEFITFHQNFSYEDFIQGLRPDIDNKQLSFERKDGIFKKIADRAYLNLLASEKKQSQKLPFIEVFQNFALSNIEEDKEIEVKMKKTSYFITDISDKTIYFRKTSGGTGHTLSIQTLERMYISESTGDIQGLAPYYEPLLNILLQKGKSATIQEVKKLNYVIIIDEINRANISRVFGELITLIEEDKRSHGKIPMSVTLPSGDSFIVPSNLYIIGTMNTADKSIALLDIALRRRFEFIPMYPQYEIEGKTIHRPDVLKHINEKICKLKTRDFQIGHAYFMESDDLDHIMNRKVIPLLLEYFMNDEKTVKEIITIADCTIDTDQWPMKFSQN